MSCYMMLNTSLTERQEAIQKGLINFIIIRLGRIQVKRACRSAGTEDSPTQTSEKTLQIAGEYVPLLLKHISSYDILV